MDLQNILFGALIGLANIIPGVSGGTMAVILNIYDDLIGAISNLKDDFRGSLTFLIPIGIGAVLAILLCSRGIDYLLTTQYMIVNFFFMGVIVGSAPMIYKKVQETRYNTTSIIPFFITFILMILMIVLGDMESSETAIETLTPISFIKLCGASAVSAACMIIPGISGSFVMLLFGVYTTIITAISQLNILILMPIGLGVLIGILGGARLIDIVLRRYPTATYFAILGFMCGSIPVIFHSIIVEGAFIFAKLIPSILFFLIGMGITIAFDKSEIKSIF